jgi:hypothetical protein
MVGVIALDECIFVDFESSVGNGFSRVPCEGQVEMQIMEGKQS